MLWALVWCWCCNGPGLYHCLYSFVADMVAVAVSELLGCVQESLYSPMLCQCVHRSGCECCTMRHDTSTHGLLVLRARTCTVTAQLIKSPRGRELN